MLAWGRKKLYSNKNGGFNHLRETPETEFPKLKTQRGAFELLKADRGGNNRPLLSIPLTNTGYTINDLKHAVSGSAVIYVRPIQSNLDMTPSLAIRSGETVYSQCVGCQKMVALFEISNIHRLVTKVKLGNFLHTPMPSILQLPRLRAHVNP